jgi:hypothetical protein
MTTDAYLVNGLSGSSLGIDFLQSRNFADNNNRVAGGGRLTLGTPNVRAGASLTTGRFNDPAAPIAGAVDKLDYVIYGCDIRARYQRLFRLQAEYARRNSDRFDFFAAGPETFSEKVDGYYVEAEVRPWEKFPVSVVARYDVQDRRSPKAPITSMLAAGSFDVECVTWGINIELWRQSVLMLNHEHWFLPAPLKDADVFGVRYAITF